MVSGKEDQRSMPRIARLSRQGKPFPEHGGSKKYCLLAAYDVKNAFNSARWDNIFLALNRLGVPAYVKRIIKNYLNNRQLMYNTEDGPQHYRITEGLPQDSVLGPLLWNIMYDALLKTSIPAGAEMVAFADNAG